MPTASGIDANKEGLKTSLWASEALHSLAPGGLGGGNYKIALLFVFVRVHSRFLSCTVPA
jgi:hypothetical protein